MEKWFLSPFLFVKKEKQKEEMMEWNRFKLGKQHKSDENKIKGMYTIRLPSHMK